MFKRVIWWTAGALMGASGSTWLQRKVKRTVKGKVAQLAPSAVAGRVTDRVRLLGDDVRGAVQEGRVAMRDREESLHRELGTRRPRR